MYFHRRVKWISEEQLYQEMIDDDLQLFLSLSHTPIQHPLVYYTDSVHGIPFILSDIHLPSALSLFAVPFSNVWWSEKKNWEFQWAIHVQPTFTLAWGSGRSVGKEERAPSSHTHTPSDLCSREFISGVPRKVFITLGIKERAGPGSWRWNRTDTRVVNPHGTFHLCG